MEGEGGEESQEQKGAGLSKREKKGRGLRLTGSWLACLQYVGSLTTL